MTRALLCRLALVAGIVVLGLPTSLLGAEGPPLRLRVATFRCDVTPPLGQPIYSSYKPLATIEHPLLAKGVVLDDGAHRYVLCAVDWCELCNGTHLMFRAKIAEAAGTDAGRVAVQTVHQHTAPMADGDAERLTGQAKSPPPHPDPKFFEDTAVRLACAVKQSLGRLEPFDQVGTGQAKVDRVASSRRVHTADGKILVRWSSCREPSLRAMPEGAIDPMIKTITFARGGKPIVRIHYYATHPQSFYGDPRASYDFPGIAREGLENKERVFQIYFTGCAGDVTAGKYNDGSREARAGLAQRLQAGMEASAAATRLEPAGPIQWRTCGLPLVPRADRGFSEAEYRALLDNPKAAASTRIYKGGIGLSFLQRRQRPMEVSSLAIGRIWIVHLPGEPMNAFQQFAQQSRPENFVCVAGYGDSGCGYLCTQAAYKEGGYEPTDSLVVPESETAIKKAIRQLLGRP